MEIYKRKRRKKKKKSIFPNGSDSVRFLTGSSGRPFPIGTVRLVRRTEVSDKKSNDSSTLKKKGDHVPQRGLELRSGGVVVVSVCCSFYRIYGTK